MIIEKGKETKIPKKLFQKKSKKVLTDSKKSDIIKTTKKQRETGTPKINQKGLRPSARKDVKMTKREFLNAVIETVANEELQNFAKAEIEKMDARNAKRAGTPSKKALENEPIKEKIIGFLYGKETPQIAREIAEELKFTTPKISALCSQLVKDGRLKVEDVKVKGRGKVKGYSLN